MYSIIYPTQLSLSEGSVMKCSSVEVLQISEITENTPDNLNNFMSLCPIGVLFDLERSPRCAPQFIPNSRLDPRAPSWSVPQLKSFKLAKLPKILPITSITSRIRVRSGRFQIRNGALDAFYNLSQTIVSIRGLLHGAFLS